MTNSENLPWYEIENTNELDSPALVVYPERVKKNIRMLKSMIDDPSRLRPHVKTNKSIEAVSLMMQAGLQKFKCATIAEAEMLALAGAQDILLAYQPVGPKIRRLLVLAQSYPSIRFSCLVDHEQAAVSIADAFSNTGKALPVYIDLNVGMNRTGIDPAGKALALYLFCTGLKGLAPVGLHAYDGHIRNPDLEIRTRACNEAFNAIEILREQIIDKGCKEPVIVAGGTPTFPVHAKRKNVECSPGTFIYWDRGYENSYSEQPFLTAALVVTRVISLPAETLICLDLGHKSISAENELQNRVFFLNAPHLKFIGQSEEHLVMEAPAGHQYKISDILYGLPVHICPTIALYNKAFTVEEQKINGEWEVTARGRRISV